MNDDFGVLEEQGWSNAAAVSAAGGYGVLAFEAKISSLQAMRALPAFSPVMRVDYQSAGRLLILADSNEALRLVQRDEAQWTHLTETLNAAMLWTGAEAAPQLDGVEVVVGKQISLNGYLGNFELVFQPVGAEQQVAPFDLVLDLTATPTFTMHTPPQGYFAPKDDDSRATALAELPQMVGEFEKPKFFAYKESICAHSRSRKTGCTQCIDVCSTKAIASKGDHIVVDPHLCMGCGACTTVCPSGALTYQYPQVSERGTQLKTLLQQFRVASKGAVGAPVVLFHNAADGRAALAAIAQGEGIAAHCLPIETWHVAAIGVDILLGAIAYGAGHVAILQTTQEAPTYVAALTREMALAQTILSALGYAGEHFSLIDSDTPQGLTQLAALRSAATVTVPAGFNLSNDKRGTIEFAIEHLVKHAPKPQDEIALAAGSPFGAISVSAKTCTLCMACAGACPESALMDGGDQPRLKFLERNCVQCGLCEKTCPENAITLHPRLLLTAQRKQEVVLNESTPFDCISCGKPMGTKRMIETMLGKLAGHSMFAGDGQLRRLQMCADCRVVDMMSNKHEISILTGKPSE